jgi:hypothetical protein
LKNRLGAYLVLGCNGQTSSDGFVFCSGIENAILDLDTFASDEYDMLINFFDNACDLFSSPMNDHNKCVNTLSLLYKNYNGYNQKRLLQVQSFIKQHKDCGIWLSLVLKEDYKK